MNMNRKRLVVGCQRPPKTAICLRLIVLEHQAAKKYDYLVTKYQIPPNIKYQILDIKY